MTDALPRIRVVSAEIERDGRYLLTQRRADAVLPLLWEFPGGKVAPDETDEEALARALHKRLGVAVQVGPRAMEVVHAYEAYALTLVVYRCALPAGAEPSARYVESLAWVAPEDFGDYRFPGADQATVEKLVKGLDG